MTKPIGAIVLAAGFSSRFGSSKLLAQLDNGQSVFQQTVERIAKVFPNRIIITRPEMTAHLETLAPDSSVISFEHAEQGMGATLAFAMTQCDDWDGCVICLGDMPFVETSSYQQILQKMTADTIVTPSFKSKLGNPVGFGSNFFANLKTLSGDSGGKKLTKAHPQAVRELQLNDPGILQDIDTLEELALYQGS